jgi:hypothetical protein
MIGGLAGRVHQVVPVAPAITCCKSLSSRNQLCKTAQWLRKPQQDVSFDSFDRLLRPRCQPPTPLPTHLRKESGTTTVSDGLRVSEPSHRFEAVDIPARILPPRQVLRSSRYLPLAFPEQSRQGDRTSAIPKSISINRRHNVAANSLQKLYVAQLRDL